MRLPILKSLLTGAGALPAGALAAGALAAGALPAGALAAGAPCCGPPCCMGSIGATACTSGGVCARRCRAWRRSSEGSSSGAWGCCWWVFGQRGISVNNKNNPTHHAQLAEQVIANPLPLPPQGLLNVAHAPLDSPLVCLQVLEGLPASWDYLVVVVEAVVVLGGVLAVLLTHTLQQRMDAVPVTLLGLALEAPRVKQVAPPYPGWTWCCWGAAADHDVKQHRTMRKRYICQQSAGLGGSKGTCVTKMTLQGLCTMSTRTPFCR